ncbi:MAG TPA: B12-binding domain-containing radical SAM protein [Candidatus Krumholzibacteria bacterium]|nr:B12-binding domain-containing radical SAM protein [Candidatus Krumholzibacteria bacterium]
MRILLVEPRTPDTFWSYRHVLPFIGKRVANPPLGLLTVAGMLPPSWELRVRDLNSRPLDAADVRWAEAVMVSAMIVQKASAADVVALCRAEGRPVIGGGPLFHGDRDPGIAVDHVVSGEAEELVPQLVRDLEAGRPQPRYAAARYPDIALSPLPRWDLVDLDDYATVSVQSCRGCPFDCEFCDVTALNGRKPRYKSPARFRAELEALRRRGWNGPTFLVDDNFVGDPRRAKELLRTVIAWRRETRSRMTFLTEASVDMAADAELLSLMAAAGFKKVFLGLETPSLDSLRECRKLQNTRGDLAQAVRAIQASGLEVLGGFIVGFDSDGTDIFERQYRFIQDAGVATAMVGMLQALPGSRLYRRLAGEGRLRGDGDGDNTGGAINFEPRLGRDVLVENYRSLVRRLYEPTVYYRRARTFLSHYRPRGPAEALSWSRLLALPRTMWRLGIREQGRRAFWRFLGGTLARYPARLDVAVSLAITGRHFRIIARSL